VSFLEVWIVLSSVYKAEQTRLSRAGLDKTETYVYDTVVRPLEDCILSAYGLSMLLFAHSEAFSDTLLVVMRVDLRI
jgi:hypothetical protein